jgi:single-stranded DNA-binding protein
MTIKGSATGSIVAEPENRVISDKFSVLSFPLYVNRRVKNRDSGEYENDPAGTTKIKVELKFDLQAEWLGKLHQGDFITVNGSFFEREYDKKDGTKGRSLQTDFIESIEVKKAKNAVADDSFAPDGGGW